jgi:hypothetical protein
MENVDIMSLSRNTYKISHNKTLHPTRKSGEPFRYALSRTAFADRVSYNVKFHKK